MLPNEHLRILRIREVKARTGLSTSTLYARMAEGKFPRPIALGENARGWIDDEITEWLTQRIAERDSNWQSLGDAAAKVAVRVKP